MSAWRSSPTRLREDAATEADLVRSGYRDRVWTELAQNAGDAAARAAVPGHLQVRVSPGAIHVANTGSALDETGVHALTALRVSAKTSGVGRFGVGFTAVRTVADEVEFRSAAGGLRFSAEKSREAIVEAGLTVPDAGAPVLRLAWPVDTPPAEGYASEIVLRVDDPAGLAESLRGQAEDLLLELDSLDSIDVDGHVVARTVGDAGRGLESLTIGDRVFRRFRTAAARWIVPVVDGVPTAVGSDVLRAPTRSDEELSLPAMVVADVPMQPDRRRVLPGANIGRIAEGYGDFLAALPARARTSFVPLPGFARSEVDGILREHLYREIAGAPWLPGVGDANLTPKRAMVLPGLTAELGVLLAEVFPDLVASALSGPRHAAALAAVDVHRIGLASLADMLSGISREPQWWGRLYDAVIPLVTDGVAAEELAALPVPLADGRTVTGPRTVVLGTGFGTAGVGTAGVGAVGPVHWARLVHPDASSPLLARLGAAESTAEDLLSDPALEALLDDLDWDDSDAVDDLTTSVLTLAAQARNLPSWLGSMPLVDSRGELRSADELLLPNAPLAAVLAEDSPFGSVAESVVDRFGADALRAVGLGWSFSIVEAELPTGPDHDLDDEESWWATLPEDPEVLVAVRDLDLVAESAWPEALSMLVSDPSTRAALDDPHGYTAWWLRTHARIEGTRLGSLRAPSDDTFAGVLDPLDHPDADAVTSALAPATCDSAWFAGVILSRLADAKRNPTPAVIARAHVSVAAAIASGRVDIDDVDLPARVRAISGALVDPDDAVVVDKPWFVHVVPADVAVLSSMDTATVLASILEVRTASESISSEVVGVGRVSTWDREPGAVLACAALGLELPTGGVVVHRDLVVRLSGALAGERTTPWWVTVDGITHCADSWERPRGQ